MFTARLLNQWSPLLRFTCMEWRRNAACRNLDPTTFYPPAGGESRAERHRRERDAKEICTSCSVVAACLADALAHDEQHGVWGGLNDVERRRVSFARSA
jgi:WhiB family redox-sensing transcriptional regulator